MNIRKAKELTKVLGSAINMSIDGWDDRLLENLIGIFTTASRARALHASLRESNADDDTRVTNAKQIQDILYTYSVELGLKLKASLLTMTDIMCSSLIFSNFWEVLGSPDEQNIREFFDVHEKFLEENEVSFAVIM